MACILTRIHIAVDGKGLRAAARKIRNEKTPYILNAVDVASRLVIGQLVILKKFLEEGSKKQPKPAAEAGPDEEWFGLAAGKVLNAEEMLDYKRRHWAIENGLHYVLDETFGEDKSTIKLGKSTILSIMSVTI